MSQEKTLRKGKRIMLDALQAKERDKLLTKYLISVGILDSNGNPIPVSKKESEKEEDKRNKRNYLK